MPDLTVIDTNVWLDWLVFDDPRSATLREAVAQAELRVIASPRMRAELLVVLQRPVIARRCPVPQPAIAAFDAVVLACEEAPAATLRCRDPADQMYLDLACAHGARWLLTRDRALLAVARRARTAFGIEVVTPEGYASAYHRG
jgi:putative PIN family toxin of toxin-antitoxin system